MGRFDGTVAMISGGARGMGASHARMLAAEGASMVIGDVLDGEGKALADELGDSATYVHLDVTSSDDWVAAYATAEQQYGAVNLLINNAGIVTFGSVEQLSPEDFRRIIDINLTGTFLGMHHGVASLRRAGGGAIVNVSSTAGMMGQHRRLRRQQVGRPGDDEGGRDGSGCGRRPGVLDPPRSDSHAHDRRPR
jgi:3alpha(or 20beta)-hydroxysteroid dehydrogenase